MFDQRPATPMEEDAAARVNKYIPPWREPYVIAMAGSSGSGKTSIAQSIIKELNVSIFSYIFILSVLLF